MIMAERIVMQKRGPAANLLFRETSQQTSKLASCILPAYSRRAFLRVDQSYYYAYKRFADSALPLRLSRRCKLAFVCRHSSLFALKEPTTCHPTNHCYYCRPLKTKEGGWQA